MENEYKVYASVKSSCKAVEAIHCRPHQGDKSKVVAAVEGYDDKPIDTRWLKSASEAYRISDDISDYIFVPVPIVTVDIPNRNMQCFPLEETTSWCEAEGRMQYETFIGKPLFLNHKNEDSRISRGIMFDSVMKYVTEYGLWKIVVLSAWDRTKDKEVADHILNDPVSEYSMGSMVKKFVEYPSGKKVTPDDPRGQIDRNGKLVYHIMLGTHFFEMSLITAAEGAADPTATNTQDEILVRPGELSML